MCVQAVLVSISVWLGVCNSKKGLIPYEPVHDKTYANTCVISKDSDQHVHPPSTARFYPSLVSLDAVEGTLDQ